MSIGLRCLKFQCVIRLLSTKASYDSRAVHLLASKLNEISSNQIPPAGDHLHENK